MMNKTYTESRPALLRVVGRWQLFALAFACIVGSGWLLVLGDWLNAAAPGGAILGLMAGTSVMLAVCAGYAELAARVPVAGGGGRLGTAACPPPPAPLFLWFVPPPPLPPP